MLYFVIHKYIENSRIMAQSVICHIGVSGVCQNRGLLELGLKKPSSENTKFFAQLTIYHSPNKRIK